MQGVMRVRLAPHGFALNALNVPGSNDPSNRCWYLALRALRDCPLGAERSVHAWFEV